MSSDLSLSLDVVDGQLSALAKGRKEAKPCVCGSRNHSSTTAFGMKACSAAIARVKRAVLPLTRFNEVKP